MGKVWISWKISHGTERRGKLNVSGGYGHLVMGKTSGGDVSFEEKVGT